MFSNLKFARLLLISLLSIAGPMIPVGGWQVAAVAQADVNAARKVEADRLLDQGNLKYQTSQFEAALQSWQQALLIYQEIKDRKSEVETLGNLGLVCGYLDDYSRAIDYLERSLLIARKIQYPRGESAALSNLGNAYKNMGNYAKAINYQEQALRNGRDIGDFQVEGYALGNLGNIYESLDNYAKAIDYHGQALTILRKIHDLQGEGYALGNLGSAYRSLGNYAQAINYHNQQLEIARKLYNPLEAGRALGNLGDNYLSLGDYAKAIEYHKLSLVIAQGIKYSKGESSALAGLGNVYQDLGDYTKAINYYEQSLVLARTTNDLQGEGRVLGGLGNGYLAIGNYAKAIDYYERSLAISRQLRTPRNESTALGNLGSAYFALKDYLKAIKFYEESLVIAQEIKNPQGMGVALSNLGNAYLELGDYAQAINYSKRSLVVVREIRDKPGEGAASTNLGASFLAVNKLSEAEANLRSAISTWESLRTGLTDTNKVSLAETQASTYRLLQKVLIRQNQPEAALEIAERGRGRAFAELLASRLQNKSIPEIQKLAQAPNLEEIRRIAKTQNATLVQYSFSSDNALYIWVIKPNGSISFQSVDLKDFPINQLVQDSRTTIGVRSADSPSPLKPQTAAQNLRQLHKLLIEPIAKNLPTDPSQRIIFIPQNSLFLVPFPALQDAQGKYLIEKHTIATAPSIQTLALTHEKRQNAPNLTNALVIGNPTMPKLPQGKLMPLPGAEKEAQEIAPILNTTALIGNQATKAEVLKRINQAPIVHLATHGFLNTVKGDIPGAIALAPSGTDNGFLTASEIFDLKLTANLVVLSACDTGRGDITGDGVIGLSRSFVAAGVPSIVVSLWAVNDNSTSLLMSEFYRNLKTNPNKAQALRQAILTTMKYFPNPIDWAAFTLIGEAE